MARAIIAPESTICRGVLLVQASKLLGISPSRNRSRDPRSYKNLAYPRSSAVGTSRTPSAVSKHSPDSTMATKPAPGVYTPAPTFFKKDLKTIDYDAQVAHAKFLKKNGISGVVLMGSTGENAHLTQKERASIVSKVHESLPDLTIMVGVAANALEDALDQIESAKTSGASYVLVLPSSYFGAGITQQGIIDWYTELADKAALPVLMYIYPGVSNGILITPETIIKLSAHPNIVGCKISHGDVAHHTLVGLNEDIQSGKNAFSMFTGLGQILLPTLTVGGKGTIDALCGAFPKIFVDLFNSVQKGDLETAKKLQLTCSRGEELVSKFGVIGIKKCIHSQGFGETYLGRAPLNQDLAPGAWETLSSNFQEMQSVDTSEK